MNFRIAIPTISRANTIVEKTLNYLKQTDIDFKKVDIFLSDGNELEDYKKSLKDFDVNIFVSNTKHVNTQRNFIIKHYKENELILGIDDDINTVEYKINDKKTALLYNLVEFTEQAFELSLSNKFDMWGINPVINPYFMKNNVTFNLKYIVACFYGWRNTYQDKAFVSEKPEYGKEDFERSIRYYIADKGVTRFNYVAPKTKYYSEKGGIQNYRTIEYEEKAVQWLLATFPMFCKRNTKSKSKYPEIRLIDQRKRIKSK
tara:strand:+ start:84 stop:860 length:777 start_codon:yes stop_codon:yes gene_type:complete